MKSKGQQARELRIARYKKKYGDTLKNVSENCRQQAIKWNNTPVTKAV